VTLVDQARLARLIQEHRRWLEDSAASIQAGKWGAPVASYRSGELAALTDTLIHLDSLIAMFDAGGEQ
jgi:hypothetical protein